MWWGIETSSQQPALSLQACMGATGKAGPTALVKVSDDRRPGQQLD